MASKYVDTTAIIQVIGNIYCNPSLLDFTDKYNIDDEDFPNMFHKIIFGSIYKLHELGAKKISIENINDFLEDRPKYQAIYKQEKGDEWLSKVILTCEQDSFDYYYNRLKKMSLLRAFDNFGIDVSNIYDPNNILDTKKKQLQEEFIDNATLTEIAEKVNERFEEIKSKYVDAELQESVQAGEGIDELIDSLLQHPEVGAPLFGPLVNTVTRGARLKKFYLRSAATGVGKTRSMIADACFLACSKYYDNTMGWLRTGGNGQPVLYITTEQTKDEVQTMMLAFISNVNEEHIINGKYDGDELERVRESALVLKNAPLFIEELPDFSLEDVENIIKKNIRDNDIKYVFDPN